MADYTNKHVVAAILTQAYASTVPGFGQLFAGGQQPVPDERNLERLGHVYAGFISKLDIYTRWGKKKDGK